MVKQKNKKHQDLQFLLKTLWKKRQFAKKLNFSKKSFQVKKNNSIQNFTLKNFEN